MTRGLWVDLGQLGAARAALTSVSVCVWWNEPSRVLRSVAVSGMHSLFWCSYQDGVFTLLSSSRSPWRCVQNPSRISFACEGAQALQVQIETSLLFAVCGYVGVPGIPLSGERFAPLSLGRIFPPAINLQSPVYHFPPGCHPVPHKWLYSSGEVICMYIFIKHFGILGEESCYINVFPRGK